MQFVKIESGDRDVNILLVSPSHDPLADILTFMLEGKYSYSLFRACDATSAIDQILETRITKKAEQITGIKEDENGDDEGYQLIIVTENIDVHTLIRLMDANDVFIPIVMRAFDKISAQEKYQNTPIVDFATEATAVEDIEKIVKAILAKPQLSGQDLLFCPLRLSTIKRMAPVQIDLYIRLSGTKYVKMSHADEPFDKDDIQRFETEKSLDRLYIRKDNYDAIFRDFDSLLTETMESDTVSSNQIEDAVTKTFEVVQNLIPRIGFDPRVVQLAQKSVQVVVKHMGKNPKLNTILARLQKDRSNYLYKHSLICAELVCALAIELKMDSKNNLLRLVAAALFHDVTLGNGELARIENLQALEDSIFTEEQKDLYRRHPMEAAAFVSSFPEFPQDTGEIILQHHEQPDGSGFPRGLVDSRINKLAALFIVAHDMSRILCQRGGKFNATRFTEMLQERFGTNKFKDIIELIDPKSR